MPSRRVLDGWLNSGNAVFWRSNLLERISIRDVAQKPHAAFDGATSFHAAFSFLAQVVWDALISHSGNVGEGYTLHAALRKLSIYCSPRLCMYSLELQSDASLTPALPHF
jgi:hypothetical protein